MFRSLYIKIFLLLSFSACVRQPKESVQFIYSAPEVHTEGPALAAGAAEMARYRAHVRKAGGTERAAGYHEVSVKVVTAL